AAARLHVNKRVLLGNFKAVEASRGRIRLLRNWLNQDPKFNWRYTIEFTPELWRRMFAARLDKLFKLAPEVPPLPSECFESADEEETALAEDRARV
uniref:TEX11 protein n=1 Tax=Macrostomum lignano TaxID=282301 RepID=A0A1I8J9C6_9PLAT